MNPEETQVQPQDIPEQSQDPVPQAEGVQHDLTEDESASALGFITTLHENMVKQQQAEQEAANQPQEEPQEEAPKEPEPKDDSVLKEIKELRKEVQGNDVQKEIADIKGELEKLLKEDGQETEN